MSIGAPAPGTTDVIYQQNISKGSTIKIGGGSEDDTT